jgi:type II secretory pathway component PulK
VVLVVIAMLTLAAVGFSDLMLTERKAAQTAGRQVRARVLAQSGAELARQFLDRDPADQTDAGGLYDNPQRFQAVLIADDAAPQDRGRCWVIAPRIDDGGTTIAGVRYGLQDESTRINLATILTIGKPEDAKTTLMALPGMTDEISDAILDWIDADDTPRPSGAESDFYGSLSPPYAARNGPPVTIEELLLVRGVTPELLFGLDAAPLGLSTAASADALAMAGVDNSDGSMDHGWAAYLTLYSAESNLKADGTAKINLNQSDLNQLFTALEQVLDVASATFIIAYRQTSPALDASGQLDMTKPAGKSLSSVLDLIGAQVTITVPGPKPGTTQSRPLPNPFSTDTAAMSTYLPKLLDNTSVSTAKRTPGRINVNQAPRAVLLCIPGITSELADQIISRRVQDPTAAPPDQKYATWLLSEGLVPLATMKTLEPFVTAGGSVYRAQIIGGFDQGGSTARLEVILDATSNPTKVLFWRDISRSPGGFPVEPALGTADSPASGK